MPRDDHTWLGYEQDRGRFCARCSCGWRSRSATSAGIAGTYWDEHHADQAAPAATEPAEH
jgi:tRNA(Ile2) C34 agmatinyltransferase TiaS